MYDVPTVLYYTSRTVPRYVRCEHCGAAFVYELTRVGCGEGPQAAPSVAVERSVADLEKELTTGAEAVPCPQCFMYQAHMTAAARRIQWRWFKRAFLKSPVSRAVIAALAAILLAMTPMLLAQAGVQVRALVRWLLVGCLVAVVVAWLAYWLMPCRPNRWSESYRREQATALACSREEFAVASLNGGPFALDLTYGREGEYAGVLFLWVLPEEIAEEEVVPLRLADGREVDVELSEADYDGVFLDTDRVDDPDGGGDREYRICLRLFDVYRPQPAAAEAERS
jgi:hypothetical protein